MRSRTGGDRAAVVAPGVPGRPVPALGRGTGARIREQDGSDDVLCRRSAGYGLAAVLGRSRQLPCRRAGAVPDRTVRRARQAPGSRAGGPARARHAGGDPSALRRAVRAHRPAGRDVDVGVALFHRCRAVAAGCQHPARRLAAPGGGGGLVRHGAKPAHPGAQGRAGAAAAGRGGAGRAVRRAGALPPRAASRADGGARRRDAARAVEQRRQRVRDVPAQAGGDRRHAAGACRRAQAAREPAARVWRAQPAVRAGALCGRRVRRVCCMRYLVRNEVVCSVCPLGADSPIRAVSVRSAVRAAPGPVSDLPDIADEPEDCRSHLAGMLLVHRQCPWQRYGAHPPARRQRVHLGP